MHISRTFLAGVLGSAVFIALDLLLIHLLCGPSESLFQIYELISENQFFWLEIKSFWAALRTFVWTENFQAGTLNRIRTFSFT